MRDTACDLERRERMVRPALSKSLVVCGVRLSISVSLLHGQVQICSPSLVRLTGWCCHSIPLPIWSCCSMRLAVWSCFSVPSAAWAVIGSWLRNDVSTQRLFCLVVLLLAGFIAWNLYCLVSLRSKFRLLVGLATRSLFSSLMLFKSK